MCLSLQAAAHQHLRELAVLRRARDRIDREHVLDVEALARDAGLSAEQFVHRFRLAYGQTPDCYHQAARNREVPVAETKAA